MHPTARWRAVYVSTRQPSGWTTLDLNLGDLELSDPGVSVLGKPQVWVAFRFTSDATGHTSPGPFVDDVLIRKCLDTLCSPLSAGRAGVRVTTTRPSACCHPDNDARCAPGQLCYAIQHHYLP